MSKQKSNIADDQQRKHIKKTKALNERTVKPKLTLAEKQELKLQRQKEREAKRIAEGNAVPKNKDRFYCNNKELHAELLKWRNSDKEALKVMKLVGDKLVATAEDDTPEGHEVYQAGTRYFVKVPKIDDSHYEEVESRSGSKLNVLVQSHATKLYLKAKEHLKELNQDKFYKETRDYATLEVTDIVKKEGWAFGYDVVEDREISDAIGQMMMKIGRKLSNHSNFRNYPAELKEDMVFFGVQKLVRGLKNYNFKFSNPFAWFSQAFYNAFLTVIYKHYKQMNIKKDLMKKLSMELESFNGIDPRSSLNKAIKQFLGEEFDLND